MHGASVRTVREAQQGETAVAEEGSGVTEHSKLTSIAFNLAINE